MASHDITAHVHDGDARVWRYDPAAGHCFAVSPVPACDTPYHGDGRHRHASDAPDVEREYDEVLRKCVARIPRHDRSDHPVSLGAATIPHKHSAADEDMWLLDPDLGRCTRLARTAPADLSVMSGGLPDSGDRTPQYGGAVRDRAPGKGRFDLISPFFLQDLMAYQRDHQWETVPEDLIEDALDHIVALMRGDTGQDHALVTAADMMLHIHARDTDNPPFPLLAPAFLRRIAVLLEQGAAKYAVRNWERGYGLALTLDSAFRHLTQLAAGDASEDHAVAVAWNMMAFIHVRHLIKEGLLPKHLSYGYVPMHVVNPVTGRPDPYDEDDGAAAKGVTPEPLPWMSKRGSEVTSVEVELVDHPVEKTLRDALVGLANEYGPTGVARSAATLAQKGNLDV